MAVIIDSNRELQTSVLTFPMIFYSNFSSQKQLHATLVAASYFNKNEHARCRPEPQWQVATTLVTRGNTRDGRPSPSRPHGTSPASQRSARLTSFAICHHSSPGCSCLKQGDMPYFNDLWEIHKYDDVLAIGLREFESSSGWGVSWIN